MPRVGEPAPELDLPTLGGGRLRLEDLRGRPLLLTFLRHAGWLICRAHLVKVLERRREIEELGASVVVVVHDSPERVRAGLLRGLDVPWPVVVDASKDAYRRWGMGRASALRTWLAPRWVLDYVRAVAGRGERLLRPGRDVLQLGGDFVVGPEGRVEFAAAQRQLDERPPVGLLLEHLRTAQAAS